MLPTLLRLGDFTLYSYGVMTGIGFVLAIMWPTYLAKKEGIAPAKMEGLGLVIVLTAGVGSKLLTALDYPGFYAGGWDHFFYDQMLGKGGVFYGGFLMAAAGTAIYCHFAKLPGWQAADCVAPGLALAQGLGRIGCFLGGCCWGKPTNLPVGVVFKSELAHELSGVPLNIKIHPTQLYEAVLVLGVIPFLLWLRNRRAFRGEVILAYVTYYAVIRFIIEFVRDDPRGHYLSDLLSTSQLISLLIIPSATFFLVWLRQQASRDDDRTAARALLMKKARAKAV